MRKQKNMFQRKEQDKNLRGKNELELSNLPVKEFKGVVINFLIKLGRIDECSESFHIEI